MDMLTNFSLKHTEIEDETLLWDAYRDEIFDYGNYYGEITPASSAILTPMMFSRHSSLDSISTTGWDDWYSVQSDYSHYISSNASPSDIPDSPSEEMPQKSVHLIKDESSSEDEDDKELLENCLQLGIYAMHPADKNYHQLLMKCKEYFIVSEKECSELLDKDVNLIEDYCLNGINAIKIRCDAKNECEEGEDVLLK